MIAKRIAGAMIAVSLLTGGTASAGQDGRLVEAIRSSVSYLDTEGDRWLRGQVPMQKGTGCISCHHVGYALWSRREAQLAGVVTDDKAASDLRSRAMASQARPGQPRVVSATQMIMAGAHSDGDLEVIRSDKKPAGNWHAAGQFATQLRGEDESDDVASLWALAALAALGSLDTETEARRERGSVWMDRAEPGASSEWHIARLVVAWRQGDEKHRSELLEHVLAAQNPDGGWGWLVGGPSNPFSTGQTVYALALVDDEGARPARQRGVAYLLDRQEPDGTWATPSELTSTAPSHEKDYIYRYWGTAWASIGLSRSLADSRKHR